MDEVERFFKCPYCHEKISMLIDVNQDGLQTYIEDCEVCCRPIQITFEAREGELSSFAASQS